MQNTNNEQNPSLDPMGRTRPLRWKKNPRYCGRMRVAESYTLRAGNVEYATAQANGDGRWFWYGMGNNTAHRPDTLEAVQKEAVAVAKEKRPTVRMSDGL